VRAKRVPGSRGSTGRFTCQPSWMKRHLCRPRTMRPNRGLILRDAARRRPRMRDRSRDLPRFRHAQPPPLRSGVNGPRRHPCVTPGRMSRIGSRRAGLRSRRARTGPSPPICAKDRRHIATRDMARAESGNSKPMKFEMAATANAGHRAAQQATCGMPGAGRGARGNDHRGGLAVVGRTTRWRGAPFIARLNEPASGCPCNLRSTRRSDGGEAAGAG